MCQQFLQIDVAHQCADHVENLVSQVLAHLLQASQQSGQHRALARIRRNQVVDVGHPFLTVAVDASHTLLQPGGYPREIIVDHIGAKLQVNALAGGFGRRHHLAAVAKIKLSLTPCCVIHTAINLRHLIAPGLKEGAQKIQRVLEFRKDQQLFVVARRDANIAEDFAQRVHLGFHAALPDGCQLFQQFPDFRDFLFALALSFRRAGEFRSSFLLPAFCLWLLLQL